MDYQNENFCILLKNVIHPDKTTHIEQRIDWAHMVQLAKEHNLLPIFMEEAVKNPTYVSRLESEEEVKQAFAIVASQTKRTSYFLNLYQSFASAGIYPIVMKGIICRELYGGLCDHRPSGDEDILIRPKEYQKAKEILIANGYVSELENETEMQLERVQEVSFIHSEHKLHIELHLNPMGRENEVRSRMSDCFKNVFDDYREVSINGVRVRTMNHQKHLLFLILHAFKHFTLGGFGIRQMLDILLYHEQYSEEVHVEQIVNNLKDFRADVFWSDLIHIGNTYLGFNLPVIQQPNCPHELLEDMFQCGAFGNKTKAERQAANATMFLTGNNLKYKAGSFVIMAWTAVFPGKAYWLERAPYLIDKPWLLPIEWIKRWGRFFKRSWRSNHNTTTESIKISQRRMKLLKRYDLV